MGYYKLDAGDKSTTKIFVGYEDGSYLVEYVKPHQVPDRLREHYRPGSDIVYLYAQHRPIRESGRYTLIDRTDHRIKKLETEAESYINAMRRGDTGRGKSLGEYLRDCRSSYEILKQIRRWTGWQPPSGRSIDEYYRRGEHGE